MAEESCTSKEGSFSNLWVLFLPLVGTTFTNYLFGFLEKLFLSRVSQKAMEAAINGAYACQIFQIVTVSLVMMAQVSIARWYGAQNKTAIGPGLWQFIWFSILSTLVTIPVSVLYGSWYFRGTEIESMALPYFYLLTFFNFLYPLAATLSCFFLGQGKTRLILFANLTDQVIKVGLSYLLIFGVDSWIQPMGVLGGVIANISSQGMLCLFFFFVFMQKKYRGVYHSHKWKIQPALFWESIRPGIFRALNKAFAVVSWGMIAHLMAAKGGNFLLILTLGGSLTLFVPFLFDAIYQSQTTVISQLVGARKHDFFFQATRAGLILVLGCILFVAIPLLGTPILLFKFLFPENISIDPDSIRSLFFGVWSWFASFTLAAVPLSVIFAFRDMKFHFYVGSIFWATDYVLMYFFIEKMHIHPDYFWLALAAVQAAHTLPIYFWRAWILCKRASSPQEALASTN